MENQGASVVITHHIIEGKEEKYEEWLNEIGPICKNSNGFVDWQIIRPIPNLTFIYTVIIRFDSITNGKTAKLHLILTLVKIFFKNSPKKTLKIL